jgi:hypothetical protein
MLKQILFFSLCAFLFLQEVQAQLTYNEVYVDYDSAWQYKDLKIIPIRRKPGGHASITEWNKTITLNKALEQGLVTIQERGTSSVENVHWLSLYNHSDKNIYVTAGEVLSGGRQDRMVTKDTLIMAGNKRSDLHVMCVEEERWSKKDKKFTYEKKANMHLRKVLDLSGNQVLIWNEINRQLIEDTIKNKTLSYLALGNDKKFMAKMDPYLQYFRQKLTQPDSTVLGVVCISGDKVIGTDIYAATSIFYDQLMPLLKGYIEEAVVYGAPVTMTTDEVKLYMDKILKDEKSQEAFVKKNGRLFKVKDKVLHITTY